MKWLKPAVSNRLNVEILSCQNRRRNGGIGVSAEPSLSAGEMAGGGEIDGQSRRLKKAKTAIISGE
jgi:hypothetical protein